MKQKEVCLALVTSGFVVYFPAIKASAQRTRAFILTVNSTGSRELLYNHEMLGMPLTSTKRVSQIKGVLKRKYQWRSAVVWALKSFVPEVACRKILPLSFRI